jgi:hypothetical protein
MSSIIKIAMKKTTLFKDIYDIDAVLKIKTSTSPINYLVHWEYKKITTG